MFTSVIIEYEICNFCRAGLRKGKGDLAVDLRLVYGIVILQQGKQYLEIKDK